MKDFTYELLALSAHAVVNSYDFQEVERAMGILIEAECTKVLSRHVRTTLSITLIGCEDPYGWYEDFVMQASDEITDYLTQSGLPTFSSNCVIDGVTLEHPTVIFYSV